MRGLFFVLGLSPVFLACGEERAPVWQGPIQGLGGSVAQAAGDEMKRLYRRLALKAWWLAVWLMEHSGEVCGKYQYATWKCS